MKLRRAALWTIATEWRQFGVQVATYYGFFLFLYLVMDASLWYCILASLVVQGTVGVAQPKIQKVAEMRAELEKKSAVDDA